MRRRWSCWRRPAPPNAGLSLDDVARVATDVAARVRLVATVPDLEHLVRSGRVPGIAGWAGRTLGLSPLFEFRTGKVHRLRPAAGSTPRYDRLVARFRRDAVPGCRPHVVALHALAPEAAQALLDRVGDADPVESFTSEFGSVMVVHAGPGLVGLAWWWEPVSPDGVTVAIDPVDGRGDHRQRGVVVRVPRARHEVEPARLRRRVVEQLGRCCSAGTGRRCRGRRRGGRRGA